MGEVSSDELSHDVVEDFYVSSNSSRSRKRAKDVNKKTQILIFRKRSGPKRVT